MRPTPSGRRPSRRASLGAELSGTAPQLDRLESRLLLSDVTPATGGSTASNSETSVSDNPLYKKQGRGTDVSAGL